MLRSGFLVSEEEVPHFKVESVILSLAFLACAQMIAFERMFSIQMFGAYGVVGAALRAIIFSTLSILLVVWFLFFRKKYSALKKVPVISASYGTIADVIYVSLLMGSMCFFGVIHMLFSFRDVPHVATLAHIFAAIFGVAGLAVIFDFVVALTHTRNKVSVGP
jgi:hypothetical protein